MEKHKKWEKKILWEVWASPNVAIPFLVAGLKDSEQATEPNSSLKYPPTDFDSGSSPSTSRTDSDAWAMTAYLSLFFFFYENDVVLINEVDKRGRSTYVRGWNLGLSRSYINK